MALLIVTVSVALAEKLQSTVFAAVKFEQFPVGEENGPQRIKSTSPPPVPLTPILITPF